MALLCGTVMWRKSEFVGVPLTLSLSWWHRLRSFPLSATPMKHSCVFAFLHDLLFGKFLGNFVFVTVASMLSLTTHAYDSLSGGSLAGGHRSLVGIVVVETDRRWSNIVFSSLENECFAMFIGDIRLISSRQAAVTRDSEDLYIIT